MLEQLKDIHAWFTGERLLPQENRSLAEQAAACYLSAKEVEGWLFPKYDPICDEAQKLLDKGIAAGEIDALRLRVYIDMGLWIRAKQDWEQLPIHLQVLYERTGDVQLQEILADFPSHLEVFKRDRKDASMTAAILALRKQGLPADLGAHDPAYYGDD